MNPSQSTGRCNSGPVLRRRRPDDRGRMTPALLSPHTAALASNGSLLGLLSEFVEANAATVHLIAGEQRTELESMAPAPSSVPCHARARDGRPSRPAHASVATRARRCGGAQRGSHLGLDGRSPRPARSRSCGSRGPWLRRLERRPAGQRCAAGRVRRCPAAPGRAPARASRPRSDRRGERAQHRPTAVASGASISSVSYLGPASKSSCSGRSRRASPRSRRSGRR